LESVKVACPWALRVRWPREVVPSNRVMVPLGMVLDEPVVLAVMVTAEPVNTEVELEERESVWAICER